MSLDVKAATNTFSGSSTSEFTYNAITGVSSGGGTINSNSGGGGYLSNGSGTIRDISGGGGTITITAYTYGTFNGHVRVPFNVKVSDSDLSISPTDNDYVKLTAIVSSISITPVSLPSSAHYSISNIYFTDNDGTFLGTTSGSFPKRIGQSYYLKDSSNKYNFNIFVEYDLDLSDMTIANLDNPYTFSFKTEISGSVTGSLASSSDVKSASNPVVDNQANELLDSIETTNEDTNTTTHSIFDSISDFFGSFFSNLIGVFVPDDDFFSTWFSNLNALLEDKLGIIYYPISFLISLIQDISNSLSSQSSLNIVFPAIEFKNLATGETYHFLDSQTINLNDYNVLTPSSPNSTMVGTNYLTSLANDIRVFNSIFLTIALFGLFVRKLHLIMRGSEDG